MTGLKDIFRKKSKKDLRGEASTSPTASPSRGAPSPGARSQIQGSPPPPLPTSPTTPTRKSASRQNHSSTQQHNTGPADPIAVPYNTLPQGTTPERGTVPLHGNATSPITNPPASVQPGHGRAHSNSIGRSAGIARVSVGDRTGAPPGTAVTTGETYGDGQRTISRSSAYTDASYYGDQPSTPTPKSRQSDRTTSRSRPHDDLLESGKRAAVAGMSSDDRHNQSNKHSRVVSNASVASNGRTPIADEFAATTWYTQRDSPPMPAFSQLHAEQSNTTESPSPAYLQTHAQQHPRFDADMPETGNTGNGSIRANGDISKSSHHRKISIPRKSLEKPLPIPTVAPAAEPMANHSMRNVQKLPLRERDATSNMSSHPYKSNQGPPAVMQPVGPSTALQSSQYGSPPAGTKPKQVEIRSGPQTIYNRPYTVENSSTPVSLEGIVDLTNTVHTHTYVHYAPAVVHETIVPRVHHVREEQITREIHNYNIHHRVLPVVDVQVLPPKHITRANDDTDSPWVEVPEHLVPGRGHQNWLVVETVSEIAGELDRSTQAPRQFTARAFEGTDGDYREYINADGVPTTETTWVHYPVISHEARHRGITAALDME